jgi:RNA 3'-terminal phosphate cyclase-like protein
VLLSSESAAQAGESPEDVGVGAAQLLLEQIERGGVVDTHHQWLPLLWMCASPEDVSKIRLGPLSAFTIQYLRDLKLFFGVTFKVQEEEWQDEYSARPRETVMLTCVGTGFINLNKKTS